ncbi:hypothetical protein [Polaribacter sp. IC073]|uniref:hypothetical protein n=1 Tax=Polaribacter sp. IC073 TaxID=2508540 RepID=UPI0011BF8A99|nr:hypothetical protein [Polaribacter sp. IC073]TXD45854.1 hypothetical protein ES045_15935 [Polaribacter sp. IC073]
MRIIILMTLLFLTQFSFGQASRKEMAESKIYVRATYFDQNNEIIGLQVRTDFKDTLIENRNFLKFKTEDFTDYSDIEKTDIYYESFKDGNYILLNRTLQTVHNIDYNKTNEQIATLFGEQVKTSLEFIDTRRSYPRDSLVATDKTPRKYFKTENSEIYALLIPALKTLAVSSDGQFYTKQLFGDNYNDISEGIKNNFQTNNRFDIQSGDEIQLFYRRKWYNDSTGIAEYQDKQFKNVKYIGDTIVDGNKSLKMEIEGYNYLSGSKEDTEEFLIQVSDSGYYSGNQFIPFKDYKTELKIIGQNGQKSFSLQGVSKDTINGFTYEKIVQATSDPYRYFILPFFPMPFVEFGNVQGIITYSKIKGIEKGTKRERTYITDENNIRDISSVSDRKVEIEIYFLDKLDIDIEIKDYETDEIIGSLKFKSKKGINSFIIETDKLEKGKSYSVQINYKGDNNSGSFSNGFKSKH